jgi:hypothetical protein
MTTSFVNHPFQNTCIVIIGLCPFSILQHRAASASRIWAVTVIPWEIYARGFLEEV